MQTGAIGRCLQSMPVRSSKAYSMSCNMLTLVSSGLHHPGMGTLPRLKLGGAVARKVLLEAHKYKAPEALEDGIVDAIAPPEEMLDVAMQFAENWKSKAKMGVYGVLRNELVGEETAAYQAISYVHHRQTTREPKVKL
jgi:Delta3-Delta2-enoyl-CoA isomerase